MKSIQLNGKVYDFVKRLVQVVIPAFASFYFGLAAVWGLPAADKVTGTSALLCTFLGVVLGISKNNYEASESGIAGTLLVSSHPETGAAINLDMRGAAVDPLTTDKGKVTFKVVHTNDPPPLDQAA